MSSILDVSNFQLQAGTTLIDASAGTGKTYTIQYIVLDLILKGIPLEEILVVTFTEAATKELKDRLQSFLVEVNDHLDGDAVPAKADALTAVLDRAIRQDEDGAEGVQGTIRKALLSVDQAAVYTIHGFCQRSLQEHAFAADAHLDQDICKEIRPIVEDLVADFVREALMNLKEPLPKLPKEENTCTELQALGHRAMKLTGMLRLAEPFQGSIPDVTAEIENAKASVMAYQSKQDAIRDEFMGYKGRLNKRSYKDVYFDEFKDTLERIFSDPDSVDLIKLTPEKIERAFTGQDKKDGRKIESGFFLACEQFINAKSNYQTRFLRCFDTWFIRHFEKLIQERNLLTYDGMIHGLDRAIKKSDTLKEALQRKYKAALVDEFQDTDARQYSIFKALFGDGKCTGHHFAMIGDPKQSIYRFRGADIDAYLEAQGDAHFSYTLPKNYRSDKKMVEATNYFFKGTDFGQGFDGHEINEDDDCAPLVYSEDEEPLIGFQAVEAADQLNKRLVFAGGLEPCRLYERLIEATAEKIPETQEYVIPLMADDIAQLLQWSKEGRVYFESTEDGVLKKQAIQPGDLAVLVEGHYEAEQVQNALRKKGVVAVRSKSGSLLQTEETRQFIHFLMACLRPSEAILNMLLVGDFYSKSDSEMTALKDAERRQIYECFVELGKEWRRGQSVSRIWLEFVDQVQLRERLIALSGGERKLTNYLHIGEYALEMERVESLSPERLLDRLYAATKEGRSDEMTDDADAMRLESDSSAVTIATMHSSKGLEYPITFLPSLWQRPVKQKEIQGLRLLHSNGDLDTYHSLSRNPEALKESSAESLRLGYVAMTRAVHFCVYYNVIFDEWPNSKKSNHFNGWFDEWLRVLRNPVVRVDYMRKSNFGFLDKLEDVKPVELSPEESQLKLHTRELKPEIPVSYQITSYSSLARSNQAADADPSKASGSDDCPVEPADARAKIEIAAMESDLLLESLPGGMRTGTCVHEILERCDFAQPDSWERLAKSVIERHFPEGGDSVLEGRVEQVLDLLADLTQQARVGTNGWSIDLSQLSPSACIPEMEFYFPVRQVDLSALEDILQRWADRVGLAYAPAHYRPREIDGYLTGSVDLFFTQGQRYFILDWKTNRPLRGHAPLRSGYDRAGMHAHMEHGRYYLQALIYSVAASAYLRHILGEQFDWETHMGGFVYCFVRGLGESSGWHHEAFSEAEVLEASQALGQSAKQGGVA